MVYIYKQVLFIPFIVFLILNISLYLCIYFFHSTIPFSKFDYIYNAHHYKQDPQIIHKQFSFITALGQYDAQWYLKIAEEGYPSNPKNVNNKNKKSMDGLVYAFFPLYPACLSIINSIFHNVELSAFIFANVFLVLNFFSLYKLICLFYPSKIAIRTIFLLFLFPFSIFYRSYFTEGLYLFLLIWSTYFFVKKKYIITSLFLGLLLVTKANGFLLNIFYIVYLITQARINAISWRKTVVLLSFMITPIIVWVLFCFFRTGNPFYFITVRSQWFSLGVFSPLTILYNLYLVYNFFNLPLHSFHYSQLDTAMILFVSVVLLGSFKKIPQVLWIVIFSLFLSPLLVTDTQSFSRYQSISFPLFMYLAIISKNFYYKILIIVFYILLLLLSIGFVNWYWIG
ncbi:MAG TPA: glycosyltransferase family 39 protein [Candidatus Saccharimonadales bacterium]|nr:glycosyltransferase family 39 protein [Candidatus Saccharimonadales bacterium]